MTSGQKTIKYLATGFAILLAIGIVAGIAAIITGIFSNRTSIEHNTQDTVAVTEFSNTYDNVKSLDIDGFSGTIYISTADQSNVSVEGTDCPSELKIKEKSDGTLQISIEDDWDYWFDSGNWNSEGGELTILVPTDFEAEKIEIDTGTGDVTAENLITKELDIDAGVGNIYLMEVSAKNADIDGGAGNITLSGIDFQETDIDCGVGDITVDGTMTGSIDIDGGVGNVELDIIGLRDEYNLDIESGMGDVSLDGETVEAIKEDNEKDNSLKIDGGVGSVSVNFVNE